MRLVLSTVLIAAVAVLAGCGGLSKEQRSANMTRVKKMAPGTVLTEGQIATLDQDNTLVCDTETGTGSHIPHRVCRPLRKVTDQANNAQTSLSQLPAGYDPIVFGVSSGGK
jgi:hypothetical protein